MKIGFEVEAFCMKNNQLSLVPDELPHDECGWLVEVRSEPHTDIEKAFALLKVELRQVKKKAQRLGYKLSYVPLMEVTRTLRVAAAREFGKGLIEYRNVYGHQTHRCSTKFGTASLHISFTNEKKFHYYSNENDNDNENFKGRLLSWLGVLNPWRSQQFKYQGFIDYARIVVGLDRAFKAEIAAARRNPGFYEVKGDGRIEYRSLPNNVNLDKLEIELSRLLNESKEEKGY